MRRVVVKLGSSVVADGDGEPRMQVLARVCAALARLHREGGEVILVSSGAIARGMRVMELGQRPTSIGELQAASAVGQGKLYWIYDELLRAQGLTSAQIAERLVLSPHTVSAHLGNIYGKIGVNSRSAATRFAIERGLV